MTLLRGAGDVLTQYEGEEIDTIKGRALFIYTDGLNEAEDLKII